MGRGDAERGEAAAESLRAEGFEAEWIPLDMTSSESIQAAARIVTEKYGKLDILINNAGIARDWGTLAAETPMAALRETFQTNTFGPYELIQATLPLLKKSEGGRIVNISSTVGSLREISDLQSPYDANRIPAYQASKTALNAVTALFARELQGTPIKINSACPGWVKTDMGTDAAPRTVAQGAATPVRLALLPADGPTGGFFDDNGPVAW